MKIAILGRSKLMLNSALKLVDAGHRVALIGTSKTPSYDQVSHWDLEILAEKCEAEYFCDARINSPKILSLLERSECDLAVSVNWPTIIRREAIAAFRYGILNAHAGDLPRYRGNACPNWAILNGEDYLGLCIHFMDPDVLDSGPVLLRDRFALSDDVYIGDVYAWLEKRIPDMFVEAIHGLESGKLSPQPQPVDPELSLRCYPRCPEDGRIDWRASARDIHRLVRASSEPFSGAFCYLDQGTKRRLIVWRAELYDHPGPFCAVPGQLLFVVDGAPLIACGDGVLRLTRLSLEGVEDEFAKREVSQSLRARLI